MNNENEQSLSKQDDTKGKEDISGGSTTSSPGQLKYESRMADWPDNNPNNVEDLDDLHEIQVDDDIGEPDAETVQPDGEQLKEPELPDESKKKSDQ